MEVMYVGVVGAGAMGRGIAQVCASAGCVVQLYDSSPEAMKRAILGLQDDLQAGVAKGRLHQSEVDAILARIEPADALEQLANCDVVVEAIVERLDAKQELLRKLEAIVRPGCILATNTSSLSVTAIAAACSLPQRIVGWHFFNPVPRMRLVEIVRTPRTDPSVVEALVVLTKRFGHHAVVTSDTPGFVVNHAGRAFVTEGLKLLAECAASHDVLDSILRSCAGFRMGPFELLDLTGLDVSVPVMESIHAQYYGDDRYRPAPLARTRMAAGLLGRKTGEGFYHYGSDQQKAPRDESDPHVEQINVSAWWPADGRGCLPENVAKLLRGVRRSESPSRADLVLLAPLDQDLSSAVTDMALDATRALAIDPLFSGPAGVTLMASPATSAASIQTAQSIFMARDIPCYTIADSPGYVAPRVIACIVNLACEMAQQGVATPEDLDAALRLGLGYPAGPFEWGDRIGSARILDILRGLQATFGDQRYRPSAWLVRRARLSLPLSAPDRAV